jgi:hypothetical protein
MTVIGGDDGEGNDDSNNNNNNNGVIHTLPGGGVDIQIRFLLYHILTIILRDNLEGVLRQIEPHFEDDINDDEDLFEGLSRWL